MHSSVNTEQVGNRSVNTVWAMAVMMMAVIAHTVLTIAMAVRQIKLSVVADLVRNRLLPSRDAQRL